MTTTQNKTASKQSWKKWFMSEMTEYFINVIYLAIFFGVFTMYQRLVLAQHEISYLEYGASLIQALILGKVIMIGDIMKLGQRLDDKPLVIITLYKSFIFTLFVGLFTIIEHAIRGALSNNGAIHGIKELFNTDRNELLARSLVIFFAFIPFFAVKELSRVLGEKKISRLFFYKN